MPGCPSCLDETTVLSLFRSESTQAKPRLLVYSKIEVGIQAQYEHTCSAKVYSYHKNILSHQQHEIHPLNFTLITTIHSPLTPPTSHITNPLPFNTTHLSQISKTLITATPPTTTPQLAPFIPTPFTGTVALLPVPAPLPLPLPILTSPTLPGLVPIEPFHAISWIYRFVSIRFSHMS